MQEERLDPKGFPGARERMVSWTDGSGNFWIFGGEGCDTGGTEGYLNDLWKFDGTNWTWISGSNTVYQSGAYGTKGIASAPNFPGARYLAVSWTDGSGNLWLFGGVGLDSVASWGDLNDLWKFDGTNWTWVSGSNSVYSSGIYGTMGIASSSNVPGARKGAVSWTDGSGNFWLFGGFVGPNFLNELWKFDGTNWTWVSGWNTGGIYGTMSTASSSNVPGGRYGAVPWIDGSGNFWLFGGYGYDSVGTGGYLNDLWSCYKLP